MKTTNAGYQPKTGQKCSCKKGQSRDNCPQCEGTGFVIDFKKIRESKPVNKINDLTRLRGFKVETLQATETKPNRVKITDLRFSKVVILNYGANHNSLADLISDFFNSKDITLTAQAWAENSQGIHLYGIYFTNDFSIQIK